jgi:aldose sugar dehydrogenase
MFKTITNLSIAALLTVFMTSNVFCQKEKFSRTQIGANRLLSTPWDIEYGPDDHLWVTERSKGTVVRINPLDAKRDDLLKLSDVYSASSQDGLCGMAIQKDGDSSTTFVYLSYTYFVNNQRRQRIVRYTYQITGSDGQLVSPMTLIENMPASNDHNAARLILGPDKKLYYAIGDQGGNQNANFCNPIISQSLPTQAEIDQKNWINYPGKVLRMNLDGSIPADNPMIGSVRSHIFSYGHRDHQGLVFGKNGILYSDEHGPDTDDELNIIVAGKNYGWPYIVGYQDNEAYDYCNWSTLQNCATSTFSKVCPPGAVNLEEKSFTNANLQEPMMSLFAVKDNYNFNDPKCQDSWLCRPNIAPSSLGIYESDAIPAWKNSLLITSLKRGKVYRVQLDASGKQIVGDTTQYFYTPNRYRDITMSPDGKTFYIITDEAGRTSGPTGLTSASLQNPASILKFTYVETVGIEEEAIQDVVKIWPNPASKFLQIEVNNGIQYELKGSLISTTGRIIKRFEKLEAGRNQLDIETIPPGLYILKFSGNNQNFQKSIIIN